MHNLASSSHHCVLLKITLTPSGNAPLLVNLASNLEPPPSSPTASTTDRALLLFGQAIQADPSLMEA